MANDTRDLIPEGVTLERRAEMAIQHAIDLDHNRIHWYMSIPLLWDDSDVLIIDVIEDLLAKNKALETQIAVLTERANETENEL